ncbi:MAG TPA: hypothetical protein VGI39_18295, partial [Polyangiaceae bacterium]
MGVEKRKEAEEEKSGWSSITSVIRDSLQTALRGPFAEELRAAQRAVILTRTMVLVWISMVVMPTTILLFVFF